MDKNSPRRVWSCTLSGEAYEERCAWEERLRRSREDYAADALALRRYMELCHIPPEECARRLGRSVEDIERRLELLELPEDILKALQGSPLSERHARALLPLPREVQRRCLSQMLEQQLSAGEAEALAASCLRGRLTPGIADERLLLNSFTRCAEKLRRCGVPCRMEHRSSPRSMVLTITVDACPHGDEFAGDDTENP